MEEGCQLSRDGQRCHINHFSVYTILHTDTHLDYTLIVFLKTPSQTLPRLPPLLFVAAPPLSDRKTTVTRFIFHSFPLNTAVAENEFGSCTRTLTQHPTLMYRWRTVMSSTGERNLMRHFLLKANFFLFKEKGSVLTDAFRRKWSHVNSHQVT